MTTLNSGKVVEAHKGGKDPVGDGKTSTDVKSQSKEFLLADYEYLCDSFWKNETHPRTSSYHFVTSLLLNTDLEDPLGRAGGRIYSKVCETSRPRREGSVIAGDPEG